MLETEPEEPCRLLRVDVQRRPGVIGRIAGLFDRRGLEMWRLEMTPAGPDRACLSVWTSGPSAEIERLRRAVENLIDVVRAEVRPAVD